jgi:hypothetical protein
MDDDAQGAFRRIALGHVQTGIEFNAVAINKHCLSSTFQSVICLKSYIFSVA